VDDTLQVMWLSGLHIPESYLTAIVQATCRRNGWPLDKSTLFTDVTQFATADELLDSEDAYGNFITGLYLEGAGWSTERSCLVRQKPKQLIQVSCAHQHLLQAVQLGVAHCYRCGGVLVTMSPK